MNTVTYVKSCHSDGTVDKYPSASGTHRRTGRTEAGGAAHRICKQPPYTERRPLQQGQEAEEEESKKSTDPHLCRMQLEQRLKFELTTCPLSKRWTDGVVRAVSVCVP